MKTFSKTRLNAICVLAILAAAQHAQAASISTAILSNFTITLDGVALLELKGLPNTYTDIYGKNVSYSDSPDPDHDTHNRYPGPSVTGSSAAGSTSAVWDPNNGSLTSSVTLHQSDIDPAYSARAVTSFDTNKSGKQNLEVAGHYVVSADYELSVAIDDNSSPMSTADAAVTFAFSGYAFQNGVPSTYFNKVDNASISIDNANGPTSAQKSGRFTYEFDTFGFGQSTYVLTAKSVSTVPVPSAVWLLGSGLLGLFGVSRRKQHNIDIEVL